MATGEAGEDFVESIRLFDVYSGPPIPAGYRSLAFALTLRAPDRTLTKDDVAAVRELAEGLFVLRGGRPTGNA
jgi:phenylalanyl-tRNA synthetase beta chain